MFVLPTAAKTLLHGQRTFMVFVVFYHLSSGIYLGTDPNGVHCMEIKNTSIYWFFILQGWVNRPCNEVLDYGGRE